MFTLLAFTNLFQKAVLEDDEVLFSNLFVYINILQILIFIILKQMLGSRTFARVYVFIYIVQYIHCIGTVVYNIGTVHVLI